MFVLSFTYCMNSFLMVLRFNIVVEFPLKKIFCEN